MLKNKIKILLKERWKFYLAGYIFGYFFSIVYIGSPNLYYLIPLKLSCILLAIILGTSIYYGSNKKMVFDVTIRLFKYAILTGALIIIFVFLQTFLFRFGIDITPFRGI